MPRNSNTTKFQARHYEALAELLRSYRYVNPDLESAYFNDLVERMGVMFSRDNPNFKPTKWVDACNA